MTEDEKPLADESISIEGLEDDDQPLTIEGPEEEEPISLVEEGDAPATSTRRSYAEKASLKPETAGAAFKRPLNLTGTGATRCRIFRSKIAQASLDFMEHQVNEWIDGEEIEVKHVGHVIGTMEGKRPEPNVIVIVWY